MVAKREIEEICEEMHAFDCNRCPIPAIFRKPPKYVRCYSDYVRDKSRWQMMRRISKQHFHHRHRYYR